MRIGQGDRVDIVLDCVSVEREGERMQLVYARLVTEPGAMLPPVPEGGRRNVVQTWLGVDRGADGLAAFAIALDS